MYRDFPFFQDTKVLISMKRWTIPQIKHRMALLQWCFRSHFYSKNGKSYYICIPFIRYRENTSQEVLNSEIISVIAFFDGRPVHSLKKEAFMTFENKVCIYRSFYQKLGWQIILNL